MKLLTGLKESIRNIESIFEVYDNEIVFNSKVSFKIISNQCIELTIYKKTVKIIGSNLRVSELSNISIINGNIKEINYENKDNQ